MELVSVLLSPLKRKWLSYMTSIKIKVGFGGLFVLKKNGKFWGAGRLNGVGK